MAFKSAQLSRVVTVAAEVEAGTKKRKFFGQVSLAKKPATAAGVVRAGISKAPGAPAVVAPTSASTASLGLGAYGSGSGSGSDSDSDSSSD